MTQTDPSSSGMLIASAERPLLLWLSSVFWLLSGLMGIVPVVTVIPSLGKASAFAVLLFVIVALSNFLSLAGAVLLYRRRCAAIPLLSFALLLYIGTLLFASRSPTAFGFFTYGLVAVSAGTIRYAVLLKRKGVLA